MRGEYFSKEVLPASLSCVFLPASLSLCRCRWLYNIVRFGACASRVLQGFKTNLVTVNDSFKHHNTTSTKRTKKNAATERSKKSKKKKKPRTNEQQTDEQTDAKRKKEKKERKEEGNELEEKKKKKKTRNKNKSATEKRKERKENRKCKWIAHSCNFYLSLLFKLGIIVKDLS